ncbi:MAG TPA: Fic family protein [bacterium]|nr:Fic family protein [bacterium]
MTHPYRPPYKLTPALLHLVAEIAERIGHYAALDASALSPRLRKNNRLRSIHASLAIENNTLSLEQVTAVIEGRHVIGLPHEIQEVRNAYAAYERLSDWQATSRDDLLAAHALMMNGLVDRPGEFRSGSVGVFKGKELIHLAPAADRVPQLMEDLFSWLKDTDEHPLVASSVFHYEFEFIHPFPDGNGRLGRLWQTLILSGWKPLLAFLPVETVIHDRQEEYYRMLAMADAQGDATPFVEFMLGALRSAIEQATTNNTGGTKSAPSRHQVEILRKCLEDNGIIELMAIDGRTDRTKFRDQILNPLIEQGLVEMTVPNKPRSSKQKYRITEKGKALLVS